MNERARFPERAGSWAGPAHGRGLLGTGRGPLEARPSGGLRTVSSGFLEATSRQQLRTLK